MRLRDARITRELKQKEVADALDCAPTSLTHWEKGAVKPPLDVLSRLCDVLGISALDLLDRRYMYDDILSIAQTPVNLRTYEQQVALNFSGSILARAHEQEIKRLDKERENSSYISDTTGLTPEAVSALTITLHDFFTGQDKSKISPIGLEAMNKLLSCENGLQALNNIAVYLRAGDYQFADGAKSTRVEVGTFTAPGQSVNYFFSLTPDMAKAIALNNFLELLDKMRKRLPQEEIDAAREEFRADMEKRGVAEEWQA
jgi:transcriptional regulator with XRE-family HTH domain